ncbi:MAG: 5'-nucleotidase C-terminal domain-containing protein [Prevotella sp.]|jgi:2',3'-cyclic-nucleotide 2'-phosphodiesterase (5'-nucleotidase family)
MKYTTLTLCLGAVLTLSSCHTAYQVTGVSRVRLLIDSTYDANPDADAAQFMVPYKSKVDSIMSPVVGVAARNLDSYQPESPLSNLLSDIMVWSSSKYNEHPDLGVYNMGGIRASIAKGDITYGDVVDVAPFENKICFLTLNGKQLMQVFREMAADGGQGVSHGVQLVITDKGELVSAKLNGEPIDPNRDYRIATIDYIAQGNDRMPTFKKGRNLVSPQSVENNTRYIIRDYFLSQKQQGKMVDAKIEGRITIQK